MQASSSFSKAPSLVSGQAIVSNIFGLKLQSDGAVFEDGRLVGYRREVTDNNVAFPVVVHAARGHRKGHFPRPD